MPDSWADLPGRCFVSHSYQDSDVVAKLQKKKGMHDKLVHFPRVEPDPSHAVSEGIATQILGCDALIYVREGASASSFWVSFERDYALRAGRPVYAYSPTADALVRDTSSPLDLDLRVMFHRDDEERIAALFEWMKTQRHVDLEEARSRSPHGGITGDLILQLQELLVEGGPILWLGSVRVAMPMNSFAVEMAPWLLSNVPEFRTDFIESQLHEHSQDDDLQDEQYVAEANEDFYREMDPYIFTPEIAVRIDPSLPKSWQPQGCAFLDLLQGDTESFNPSRVDDLIIRLYAAEWQQRRRRIASPPYSNGVSVEHLGRLVMYWDENAEWTGRMRIGVARNPDDARVPQRERWWLGRWEGQKLLDDCALALNQLFEKRPNRISRQTHPHLLFDEDLAPAFAVAWRVEPAIVELSLVIEDPYSMVFLRRYAIDSIEGGLPPPADREMSRTRPKTHPASLQ